MDIFGQGIFKNYSNGMFCDMSGPYMSCSNYPSACMPVSLFDGSSMMDFGGFYSQPLFSSNSFSFPMTNMNIFLNTPVFQNCGFNWDFNTSFNSSTSVKSSQSSTKTAKKTTNSKAHKESKPAPTTLEGYRTEYGMTEKTLPNGLKVLACRWSRFDKCQSEWLDMQKYMLQAAEELRLTLVYSDVERTNAESEVGWLKKGDLVIRRGGSHNHGVAADIILFKDGKVISSKSDLQRQFANRVKELSGNNVVWGGDWKKDNEQHHFEIANWKQKYGDEKYSVG